MMISDTEGNFPEVRSKATTFLFKMLRYRAEGEVIPNGLSFQWWDGPTFHLRWGDRRLRFGICQWRPYCWYVFASQKSEVRLSDF